MEDQAAIKQGSVIIAYGQRCIVDTLDEHGAIINITHPIVVPGREYTRDYLWSSEVQYVVAY